MKKWIKLHRPSKNNRSPASKRTISVEIERFYSISPEATPKTRIPRRFLRCGYRQETILGKTGTKSIQLSSLKHAITIPIKCNRYGAVQRKARHRLAGGPPIPGG